MFKQFTAEYTTDLSLRFLVKILGERSSYGRKEVLITPIRGNGQRWVTEEKITKLTTPK